MMQLLWQTTKLRWMPHGRNWQPIALQLWRLQQLLQLTRQHWPQLDRRCKLTALLWQAP
jgi:hypothetical protein